MKNILSKYRVNAGEISYAFVIAKTMVATTCWPGSEGNGVYKETFICIALGLAADKCKIARHVSEAAVAVIEERLGGYYCLDDWVQHHLKVEVKKVLRDYPDAMQEFRHRWLDELIREFSERAGLRS